MKHTTTEYKFVEHLKDECRVDGRIEYCDEEMMGVVPSRRGMVIINTLETDMLSVRYFIHPIRPTQDGWFYDAYWDVEFLPTVIDEDNRTLDANELIELINKHTSITTCKLNLRY